jgi:hypothetical protein
MVNWGTSIASAPTMTKPSTVCSTGSHWPGKGTALAHSYLGDIHCLLISTKPSTVCSTGSHLPGKGTAHVHGGLETSITSSPTMTRRSNECRTGLHWPGKGTEHALGELGDIQRLLANYDHRPSYQLYAAQDHTGQVKELRMRMVS